jgi:chromosomal replication initiator protein
MSYAAQLNAERKARLARLGVSRKATKELDQLLSEQSELIADIKESETKVPDVVAEWVQRQRAITAEIRTVVRGGEDARPSLLAIQSATAAYFNLSRDDMKARRRTADVAHARLIGYYLCKKLTLRSLPEIGRFFGGRDHTTVLHGIRKIEHLVRKDWEIAYDVAHIEASLS